MNDVDTLKKSVTADDYVQGAQAGQVLHFLLPGTSTSPDLPYFWSYARDWMLYSTIYRESMWAAAVYLAVTKQASKSWEVESDIPKRQKDAQQLFLHFGGGNGWVAGISKHLQSYLLTDNGGPIEIIRATGAPGAKVLGLVPLDPFRTIRTGDPAIPYLYTDRRGRIHELRDYDAFCITDQPDLMNLWYGVGHCAASRAYKSIEKLEAIERFIYEKVSGKRSLALDFISGVVPAQVQQAQDNARNESAAKGVFTYMGSTIIPMAGDQAPTHVRVNLAELPNGFERKEEFDITILTYARSLGIPVQDLQPLSGQGLGTGAQAQVQEESAKGQGLATWPKSFGHCANEFSLDDRTTFYFRENDIRDREREAKIRIDEGTAIKTWIDMQAITIEQARQLGVDRDQLPLEFIKIDETPGDGLSDNEKPVEAGDVTPEDTAVPVLEPTTEPVTVETDSILKNARAIYQSITGGEIEYRNIQPAQALDPALAETTRKAVDIAWTRIKESDSVIAAEMQKTRESIQASIDRQGEELKRVNKEAQELRAALDASDNVTGEVLREMLKGMEARALDANKRLDNLRKEISAKPDADTLKALASSAASQAADSVAITLKHAEDLTVKQEILETDRNGLASKVRRTLADGSTQDFRVMRNGSGRIKALELIK